jgi:hypothetical protein
MSVPCEIEPILLYPRVLRQRIRYISTEGIEPSFRSDLLLVDEKLSVGVDKSARPLRRLRNEIIATLMARTPAARGRNKGLQGGSKVSMLYSLQLVVSCGFHR